jgi:LysM repeat protein
MKKYKILSLVTTILTLCILTNKEAYAYEIKKGDTLSSIAFENQTTVEQLATINNIKNIHLIFEGDNIGLSVEQVTPEKEQAFVEPYAYEAFDEIPQQEVYTDQSDAKEWIAQKESTGSYDARNGRYIGRYQLDSSYLNGDYSPENQERVADSYVAGRYGSWEEARNFWIVNGWY